MPVVILLKLAVLIALALAFGLVYSPITQQAAGLGRALAVFVGASDPGSLRQGAHARDQDR